MKIKILFYTLSVILCSALFPFTASASSTNCLADNILFNSDNTSIENEAIPLSQSANYSNIETTYYDEKTNISYHLYNKTGDFSVPVVYCFHGVGKSVDNLPKFSIYKWIKEGIIAPEGITIVLVETENSGMDYTWKPYKTLFPYLVVDIESTYHITGPRSFMGFSMGGIDSAVLLSSCAYGAFKNLILVDAYVPKEDISTLYNKGLQNAYIIGAYYDLPKISEDMKPCAIASTLKAHNINVTYIDITDHLANRSTTTSTNIHPYAQAYAIATSTSMTYCDEEYTEKLGNDLITSTKGYGDMFGWIKSH